MLPRRGAGLRDQTIKKFQEQWLAVPTGWAKIDSPFGTAGTQTTGCAEWSWQQHYFVKSIPKQNIILFQLLFHFIIEALWSTRGSCRVCPPRRAVLALAFASPLGGFTYSVLRSFRRRDERGLDLMVERILSEGKRHFSRTKIYNNNYKFSANPTIVEGRIYQFFMKKRSV